MGNALEQVVRFYDNLSDDLSYHSVGMQYANLWWRQWSHLHPLYGNSGHEGGGIRYLPEMNGITNFILLNRHMSLSKTSKRAYFLSNQLVFSHYKESEHEFYRYVDSPPNPGIDSMHNECYIRCPDIRELGKWLLDYKEQICKGSLFYYPDILVKIERETSSFGSTYWEEEPAFSGVPTIPESSCALLDTYPKMLDTNQFLRFICEIDIPYIDNVDAETMMKLTEEIPDSVYLFRRFLEDRFLELTACENKIDYDREVYLIGRNIRDGVRELSSQLGVLRRKTIFDVSKGVLATIVATLVSINISNLDLLAALVGGSSVGFLGIADFINKHIESKKKIESDKYYYFWLLHNKK